jgi:NTE family protein
MHATATAAPRAGAHTLALVIGSGGVRSIAALGLVEVLQQAGLRPSLVVGCSAGAIFGALIASGHSCAEATRLALALWSAELTRQRRFGAIARMLMPRTLRFDADFSLRDDRLILQRLRQAFGDSQLETLPTPLRVTATDAADGAAVVLRQGGVVQALRASIAMPFLFAPQRIGGRRLIDGFVSDPLPVSAAADARAIVTLGFLAPMPRCVDGPTRLLAQMSSALTNNLMMARLAAANTQKVVQVFPQLERRVGLFDTAAMPMLVEAGRQAARAQLPAIMAMMAAS